MDFINFIVVEYKRPYVKVELICDETKYTRGRLRYNLQNNIISAVESAAVFEFAASCLYIHGDQYDFREDSRRTQSASVRDLLGYNTARVITNKYMKRVNP